ncbi:FAD-dependent oxidoreductase [Anaerosporomusa subterranea]|uniref:FAD-dependent oxidoreductase n=1 Tax=Anaerosporomusa subterranea TaxID=1794912 RepID=UPI001E30F29E|nr:FAD-dependent oxidoreductase [Anaerosporomusa subterranea]
MVEKRCRVYDVVIVGGGSAGIAAAVGAAALGAKTLLIERSSFLGGQATNCSIPTYDGFFTRAEPSEQVVGGVGRQIIDKLSMMNACQKPLRSPWGNVMLPVNNEAVKVALDACIEESGADFLLHTRVIGAEVSDGGITAVECVDDGGVFSIKAAAFVDASGECNLTAMARGGFFTPDPADMQVGTLLIRFGGVSQGADLRPQCFKTAIASAKASGIGPLSKDSGFVMRVSGSNDVIATLANERVNALDSASLTAAEIAARKQARAYLQALRQFLPGFEDAYINQTGPQLGIRETRHAIGEYVITGEDVVQARRHEDAVARGCWPVERHSNAGALAAYEWILNDSYYDIPLRSLKNKGLSNLWGAGRTVSCDLIAFASVRVMGTAFATGHAAGVAAALFAQKGYAEIAQVQAELVRQKAII